MPCRVAHCSTSPWARVSSSATTSSGSTSPKDIDAACHFVGDFAWCARHQGWSDEEILRVVRPLTAKRALEELLPYIEYVPPSVSPPPNSPERYAEGCALLADDPNVRYRPLRFLLRPLREAIKQGGRYGWFTRPPSVLPEER